MGLSGFEELHRKHITYRIIISLALCEGGKWGDRSLKSSTAGLHIAVKGFTGASQGFTKRENTGLHENTGF